MRTPKLSAPPILYGAYALAGLSLIWSGYAITDLMHSGPFGVSVAVAGDIGWMSVLWAEHHRRGGRTVTIAGWVIAVGVGVLLALHGVDERSVAQAIAGPFVVLVGKTVGTIALLVMRDPAALTAEQEAEINDVIRDGEYKARLHAARLDHFDREADARIARIHAEARVTLARDDADFEIGLQRLEKRAEIERNSRIAIAPITPEQPPITIASTPEQPIANPPATSPITDREQPSITDLAREHVAITPDNAIAVRAVLAIRPDANKDSVAAAVRRARAKMIGGYN
ncbi:hypothetical protein ACGFY0_45335 [Streptomyces chartreusis]|uniref:hypothetical protein n=1 Tax=Streptomyces chartreusis TaxID=1969 RepID=UPI00371AE0A5